MNEKDQLSTADGFCKELQHHRCGSEPACKKWVILPHCDLIPLAQLYSRRCWMCMCFYAQPCRDVGHKCLYCKNYRVETHPDFFTESNYAISTTFYEIVAIIEEERQIPTALIID